MTKRSAAPRPRRALLRLAPLALLALGACSGGPAEQAETLPPGADPEKVRFFCTEEGDRAAALVGFPKDYVASRTRARDAAFAACMARHHVRP